MGIRIEIHNKNGEIENILEFVPVWLSSGKFDYITQKGFDKVLESIQDKGSIVTIKYNRCCKEGK